MKNEEVAAFRPLAKKYRPLMTKKNLSTIINLLFDVLRDNTRGHFTHCSNFSCGTCRARKNTTQLVKYPRVLSRKTSNKVLIKTKFSNVIGYQQPDLSIGQLHTSCLQLDSTRHFARAVPVHFVE